MVTGIVVGTALIAFAGTVRLGDGGMFGSWLSARGLLLLVPYMLLLFGVCMLACVVPTRRALAVQPSVALRAE